MTARTIPAPALASTADNDAGAELAERIRALDDFGRRSALMFLAGHAPEAVRKALDALDDQAAAFEAAIAERRGDSA